VFGLVRQCPAAELREDDDQFVLTEQGEAFYRGALGTLPRVRGYNWRMLAPGLIEPAGRQLAHRWHAREATPGPA
jgi:hypothetical protein